MQSLEECEAENTAPTATPSPRDFASLVIPGAVCSASLPPPACHSCNLPGAATWPLSRKSECHCTKILLHFPSVPVLFDARIINSLFSVGKKSLILIQTLYFGVLMHKNESITGVSIYAMRLWRLLYAVVVLCKVLFSVYLHTNS